jgi:hypothetical protein
VRKCPSAAGHSNAEKAAQSARNPGRSRDSRDCCSGWRFVLTDANGPNRKRQFMPHSKTQGVIWCSVFCVDGKGVALGRLLYDSVLFLFGAFADGFFG